MECGDDWHTAAPLWLIENQALFDDTSWLPAGAGGTLCYYSGQLSGLLLNWLAERPQQQIPLTTTEEKP